MDKDKNTFGEFLSICRDQIIWLLLLLITDLLFGTFLWLLDTDSFFALLAALLLGSFLLFAAALFLVFCIESRRDKVIRDILENPELVRSGEMQHLAAGREKERICVIADRLRETEQELREQRLHVQEYEEYIETWAHEIKTPLSLMTFLLDNRREELPLALYHRLEYVRSQLQENVNQMLYYARLKAAYKDYLFEKTTLSECCDEALSEYRILLKERGFQVINEVEDIQVVTDRKGIEFILGQVIGNSVKYAKTDEKNPLLLLSAHRKDETGNKERVVGSAESGSGRICLSIKDSGIGVRTYDLPFIFEKGFTGDTGEQRKKATGMGLYLMKQMADDLNIDVEVKSEAQHGFEIILKFPFISEKEWTKR